MKRATLYSRSTPKTNGSATPVDLDAPAQPSEPRLQRTLGSLKPHLKSPYVLLVLGLLAGAASVWAIQRPDPMRQRP